MAADAANAARLASRSGLRPRLRTGTILLSAAASAVAMQLANARSPAAPSPASGREYPVDFAAGEVYHCTVPGCTHGPITTKQGFTLHEKAHVTQTYNASKLVAAMAHEGAFHQAYKPYNAKPPPEANAVTAATQIQYLASVNASELTIPGRYSLMDRLPDACRAQACIVFTRALTMAADPDPNMRAAGINLLAIFPAAVYDKALRGNGTRGNGTRGSNSIQDNLSALIAGDYISVIDRVTRKGDARAAIAPPPPKPPPDPDSSAAPLTQAQMNNVTKLTRLGNLSKAATALTPAQAAAATTLNIETVLGLFPDRTTPLDIAGLTTLLQSCPHVNVTTPDILAALRKTNSKRGKAEGVTGFTNSHLLDLVGFGATQDTALVSALKGFAEAYLNGAFIGCEQADWLTRARFIALVKTETDSTPKVADNGGDALRPLGMQETLSNFCARCFLTTERSAELLRILEPLGQYGCGTSSGCHAVALAVTTWLRSADPFSDEAQAALQSDISNAFNEFETQPALLSVHKHFPALFPGLMFSYARDRELLWANRSADGDSLIRLISQRGSSQGDVWANLFYAFAAIAPLLNTREAFPDVNLLCIVDDAHLHHPELSEANAAFLFYAAQMDACGWRTNIAKSYAYSHNVDLTSGAITVSALCTPRPPALGIVSVGSPIGSDNFVVENVRKRLAAYLSQLANLEYYAKFYPEEAFRLVELCFARRADFLAGTVDPRLARTEFDAYDAALRKVLVAIFPAGPPAALYWPPEVGGWGLPRPYAATRPALFIGSQLDAAHTLTRLSNPTALLLLAPGSAFAASLVAAADALPSGRMLSLELQNLFSTIDSSQLSHAEQLSTIDNARALASSAVSNCGKALIVIERTELTDQQLSIIAGNAPASKVSPTTPWRAGSLDQRHTERLTGRAWRDLAHSTLAVCPPSLIGLTEPDDPLGRKALSHKSGAGLIKRHNLLGYTIHQFEQEANRAARMEVPGLYPGTERRVDTHGIIPATSEAISTDVNVMDPHTAARVSSGATVESCIKAAEKVKDDKYNSPDLPSSDGSTLFPLVFTPGGRIGPSAEVFLRRLARERACVFLPLGENPSPGALHAIYRHYRRRLAHALARGLALQIAIYGLERRVGPPTAAALRAAYPCLVTPSPNFILGHRLSTARSSQARLFPRKGNRRTGGT